MNPAHPPVPPPSSRVSIVIFLAAVLVLAWLRPLDTLSEKYVDQALNRAMVTFAAARTANAVISVVQSTTVSAVVMSASPGQALDPLNDVVEDFSNLMLAACVSLGAQKLLISIGALRGLSIALSLAMAAWALIGLRGRIAPSWLVRSLVMLLFVRFAIPIAALGSEALFELAMSKTYDEAQAQVQLTIEPPASADLPPQDKDLSAWERMKIWVERQGSHLRDNVAIIKARLERGIQHMITLMAVFVVQTAILPVLLLWLSYRLFAAALRWQPALRPLRSPA